MVYRTGKTKEGLAKKSSTSSSILHEREILKKYIVPLASSQTYNLTYNEDAAVVEFPAGRFIVITSDVIVEGVHFLSSDPPETVAKKALRVNLSDLAAMGAHPIGYTLCLSLGDTFNEAWIEKFVQGLSEDHQTYRVSLFGGDISKSKGPINIAVTAIGDIADGQVLGRNMAQPGDRIYVTGTIGDATVGLSVLQGKFPDLSEDQARYFISRYHLPQPKCILAQNLCHTAHAAIDISDGLLSDLQLICEGSHVHAYIRYDRIPLSKPMRQILQGITSETRTELFNLILTGGDDYELIFTVSPGETEHIEYLAKRYHVPITCIGHLGTLPELDEETSRAGVLITLLDGKGQELPITNLGYQHQWNV